MTELLDPDELEGVTWHYGDAARIPLPDESVPCIVTSPPYNLGLEYANGYTDQLKWPVYWAKVRLWVMEMQRVLQPGGRLWLVVQPTVPFTPGVPSGDREMLANKWANWLEGSGLAYRDQIVWRQDSFDGGCAWGSWLLPTSPNIRGCHEVILCFYKPPYARPYPSLAFKRTDKRTGWKADREDLGGDWVELVTNVWVIPPMRKDADYYKGGFPIEIPARCIRLSTWPNELVLDPFAGRGTTGWACEQLADKRRALLIDLP